MAIVDKCCQEDRQLLTTKQSMTATKQLLSRRCELMERFVIIRNNAEGSFDNAKRQPSDYQKIADSCSELSLESNIDRAVRVGDILALQAESYFKCGDSANAAVTIRAMKQKKIPLEPFLDMV